MGATADNINILISLIYKNILLVYILLCIILTISIFLRLRSKRINQLNRILDRKYRISYYKNNSKIEFSSSKQFTQEVCDDSILNLASFVSATDILYHYSKIDAGVIDAIHKAHGEKAFRSYGELSNHVDEVAKRGNENWNGMVNQYKGYFGEKIFASYLEGQGFKVEYAPYGQEGWDLLINNEKWQIKSGIDPEHIEQHRERFPDVKVLTVSEHADRFKDDEMVYALPISGQDIENVTEDTLHGVRDIDEAGIDFPVVAFLASCYRNSLRYKSKQITFLDATKNTAVDVTSVGIGGYAGAEVGSWIGEYFGEAATASLELIGGRLGVMLMREGIDYIRGYKYRDLKKYISQLENKLSEIPILYVNSLTKKIKHMESYVAEIRPSGIRYMLWPNISEMTMLRISNRQIDECQRYKEYGMHLRKEIYEKNADKKRIAATIFRNENNFPILDLKYKNTKKELYAINHKILEEKKRLNIN